MADESDMLLFLDVLGNSVRKPREFKPRMDAFTEFDDDNFHRRFRLTKPTVLKLLEQVTLLSTIDTIINHSISFYFRQRGPRGNEQKPTTVCLLFRAFWRP